MVCMVGIYLFSKLVYMFACLYVYKFNVEKEMIIKHKWNTMYIIIYLTIYIYMHCCVVLSMKTKSGYYVWVYLLSTDLNNKGY